MTERLKQIHALYVSLTGMSLRYDFNKEYQWAAFVKRGFTDVDLRDVIKHLKSEIKIGKRNIGALKFSNLVWNLDGFEEDLALVRALKRVPRTDRNREAALNSSGRNLVADTKDTSRSAADILAGEKAFEALKVMRDHL